MEKFSPRRLRLNNTTAAASLFLSMWVCQAVAAPGTLSNVPLYAGFGVEPNVLYVMDDSGSMRLMRLKSNSAEAEYPAREYREWDFTENRRVTRYVYPVDSGEGDGYEFAPDRKDEWLELCPGYNVLAFDPARRYPHWTGYYDRPFTGALLHPTWYGSSFDLGPWNPKFVVWKDGVSEGTADGEFDKGECGDLESDDGETRVSSWPSDFYYNVSEITNAQAVALGYTDAAELKQNYANWFTYHRSRTLVMRGALLEILENSSQRAGLATINNDSDVATAIDDLDSGTHRTTMKNRVTNIDTQGGTPLRQALHNAGKYFDKAAGTDPDSGFIGTNASPILPVADGGACQQNYTVIMTDGYWNGEHNAGVGNLDGDTLSNTLGDIAAYYYDTDLANQASAGLDGYIDIVTSNNSRDTARHQHMVTYGVTFGVFGNIDPDSSEYTWPTQIDTQSPESIDDLLHATVNSRGDFYSASDALDLADSLRSIESMITENAAGTAAAAGFNSTSIAEDTLLFQGWFDTSGWMGKLFAYPFSSDEAPGEDAARWEAGSKLAERVQLDNPNRQIVTYNGVQGVPFEAPADYQSLSGTTLASAQVDDLLRGAPADAQEYLERVVAFLRGDTDFDGTLFRDRRGWVLGDIVYSSPRYVGAPNAPYPNNIESDAYQTWASSQSNRAPLVYVGANDGMLHAFDATENGGDEVFAYIPGVLFSTEAGRGLHELVELDYAHIPYVDATPTSGDVYVNGSWKTYLVGGFRGGAKGIYVLDVTNPSALRETNAANIVALPEFTHANLGYTFSQPQIAKLNNGEWVAIFGNGYNNTGSGEASLFILYLDGREGTSGPAYREITTGAGSITNGDCEDAGSDCNGLSTPTVLDLTGDAIVDRIYAGDVHGNMWAFDISSDDPADWGIAHSDGALLNPSPEPLMRACRSAIAAGSDCPVADRQPITARPRVVGLEGQNSIETYPNLLVLFGTGQFVAEGDETTTDTQSFYGVWDAGGENGGLQRANLVAQSFSASGANADGRATRSVSSNEVNYELPSINNADGVFGWRLDFESRERSIVNPLIVGDFVIFATSIPGNAPCEGAGRGYLTAVELRSGRNPTYDVLPDIDGDDPSIEIDNAPGGTINIDRNIVTTDLGGNVEVFEFGNPNGLPHRRSSWTQLK